MSRYRPGSSPDNLFASASLFFLVLPIVSLFGTPAGHAYEWSITTIPQSPKAQQMHSAIYDSLNNRMIVCCQPDLDGQTNDVYALDLSTFDGSWSLLTPNGTAPERRYDHAAIYDAANGRMVLFGGRDWPQPVYGDVYALDLAAGSEAWTELHPTATPPSARWCHWAMYDPVNQRMIVFCGLDSSSVILNDVYSLGLIPGAEEWTELHPSGEPPSPRMWSSAIYDPVNHRMVVFAGDTNYYPTNDLWALDLTLGSEVWTELTPSGTPPSPRSDHTAIYDPVNHSMVVYAGCTLPPNRDLFALELTFGNETWSQLNPSGNFRLPEEGHTAIYDPSRPRMLVFGGIASESYLSYTYSLDLSLGAESWTRLYPQHEAPITRDMRPCAIYDPQNQQMVLFGGRTGGWQECVNDVSVLNLDAGDEQWRPVPPSGAVPPETYGACEVYDPVGARMIIYSGDLNWDGVYAFNPKPGTEEWTQLNPSGNFPPGRRLHTGVYDPMSHRMVIFGGYGPATGDNRSWTLDLTSGTEIWHLLDAAGTPPPWRANHSAIYEPLNHRMLVWGGGDPMNGYRNDLWALDLTFGSETWFEIHATGMPPSPRGGASAVYDPVNQRMIVFGGEGPGQLHNDVHMLEISLGSESWEEVFPGGTMPPPRGFHSAIYDSLNHRMIIFDGTHRDRQAYALSLPVGVEEEPSYTWSIIPGPDLFQNRPNPFSSITTIAYRLNRGEEETGRRGGVSTSQLINLSIYDISGRLVKTLVQGETEPGHHAVTWDGRDTCGREVSSGIYLCRLTIGGQAVKDHSQIRKMLLVR